MRILSYSKFLLLVGVSVFLAQNGRVLGCECTSTTVCQAYSRAEAVFIGKVVDLKSDSTSAPTTIVEFQIEKSFKGTADSPQTVSFPISDCFQVSFKVGERYFVYKDPPSNGKAVCNRTDTLFNSKAEVDYANSLSQASPIFTIGGNLRGFTTEELAKTKVVIRARGVAKTIPVDKDGFYKTTVSKVDKINIKILLPSVANIYMKDLDALFQLKGESIEYVVQFRPNECDYREITASKKPASKLILKKKQ